MKKITIFIALVVLICIPSYSVATDYQFYFFGINAKYLKKAKWEQVALGAASAILVHVGGHYIYGKADGVDFTMNGFWKEDVSNTTPSHKQANFSRSGFVAQSIVGLALTYFDVSRSWDFTRGYVAMSAIETLSYPIRIRNEGDISGMNKNGNGDLEWAGYSLISIHNLLRVDYKKR